MEPVRNDLLGNMLMSWSNKFLCHRRPVGVGYASRCDGLTLAVHTGEAGIYLG